MNDPEGTNGRPLEALCLIESEVAEPQPDGVQRVAFDALDKLSVSSTLPVVLERALEPMIGTATDLVIEGGRGAAARRLLARDVVTSRVRLRYYQSLLNLAVKRLYDGGANEKQVKLLERIVDAEHRRMTASLELLARMDSPVPSVHVRAQQAAVVIAPQGT